MRKKIKVILILFFLILVYIYVTCICFIPDSIYLMQGDKISFFNLFGINYNGIENEKYISTVEAVNLEEEQLNEVKKINLNVSLFNTISLKDVSINVIPKTKVILLGNMAGLKLYTKGVLVVGLSEIEGKKPFENTGIVEGTRIIQVDNTFLTSTEDLVKKVNDSNGNIVNIKYINLNNEEKEVNVLPVKTYKNEYKLGLWVRDAAAGVGTLTFYEPESRNVWNAWTWSCRCRYRRINNNF